MFPIFYRGASLSFRSSSFNLFLHFHHFIYHICLMYQSLICFFALIKITTHSHFSTLHLLCFHLIQDLIFHCLIYSVILQNYPLFPHFFIISNFNHLLLFQLIVQFLINLILYYPNYLHFSVTHCCIHLEYSPEFIF